MGHMKSIKRLLFSVYVASVMTVMFPFSAGAAGDTGTVFADAAVAVDVIVSIDKDTRVITLKDEAGEYYTFTAGPEVKNFAQLKRGDRVLMEYYSGFAIALNPAGSAAKDKASAIQVETAEPGEKPGVKVTSGTYASAEIVDIDREKRVVVLQGAENVLVLKVSDQIDMAELKVGEGVDALYMQSYAISVEPAPKVSGTVKMKTKAVAVGIGISWGEGELDMYDGTQHEFSVSGLSVLDVGITSVEATGEVYNLVEAKDLEGVFVAGEAGATMIGGGSVLALKNGNGVVMKLKSTQKGLRLSLSGEGLKVKLK